MINTNLFNFFPICPEIKIGLGIPRKTLRIVMENGKKRLIQPETDMDFTNLMQDFAFTYLQDKTNIDGFILTNDSPSTGIGQVKHYKTKEAGSPVHKMGSGIFAESIIRKFPGYPIESHRRLQNSMISEIFFTKVFALAKLRQIQANITSEEFSQFHISNKLLFKLYNGDEYQKLTNQLKRQEDFDINDYREHLLTRILIRGPEHQNYVQLFEEMYNIIESKLEKQEITYYHDRLFQFKKKKINKEILFTLFQVWALRFDHEFLKNQTVFHPFPIQLMKTKETFKDRYLEISYRLNY